MISKIACDKGVDEFQRGLEDIVAKAKKNAKIKLGKKIKNSSSYLDANKLQIWQIFAFNSSTGVASSCAVNCAFFKKIEWLYVNNCINGFC